MSESGLLPITVDFSKKILRLAKELRGKNESLINSHIVKSGTSIGSNVFEAEQAKDKTEKTSKLETALKEANETGYWLELLYKTNYIDEVTYKSLNDQCASIRVLLIASCRTAKSKTENK